MHADKLKEGDDYLTMIVTHTITSVRNVVLVFVVLGNTERSNMHIFFELCTFFLDKECLHASDRRMCNVAI